MTKRDMRDGNRVSSHAHDSWYDAASEDFDAANPDETSRISRRRISLTSTCELTLSDLIDLTDEELRPSVAPADKSANIAPAAISTTPPPSYVLRRNSHTVRMPPPSRASLLATAVVAGLATLACAAVVALVVTVRTRGRVEPRVVSAPEVAPTALPLAPPPLAVVTVTSSLASAESALRPSVPSPSSPPLAAPTGSSSAPVDVANLPRVSPGTVVGLAGRRLWIDGHLEADSRAVVPCGQHTVQVGSAGAPRSVDVPCGKIVRVAP
jgi:hypothetical protein